MINSVWSLSVLTPIFAGHTLNNNISDFFWTLFYLFQFEIRLHKYAEDTARKFQYMFLSGLSSKNTVLCKSLEQPVI